MASVHHEPESGVFHFWQGSPVQEDNLAVLRGAGRSIEAEESGDKEPAAGEAAATTPSTRVHQGALRMYPRTLYAATAVVLLALLPPAAARGEDNKPWAGDGGKKDQASSFSITSPWTSVRRKSRPWKRYVNFVWSRPSRCRIVACKS